MYRFESSPFAERDGSAPFDSEALFLAQEPNMLSSISPRFSLFSSDLNFPNFPPEDPAWTSQSPLQSGRISQSLPGPVPPPEPFSAAKYFENASAPLPQEEEPSSTSASRESDTLINISVDSGVIIGKKVPSQEGLHACPFGCCGKSYRRKGDLKFHVLHKHPQMAVYAGAISKSKSSKDGKDFPCPFAGCKCGFKWKRDLLRHCKTKHPNKKPPFDHSNPNDTQWKWSIVHDFT